MEIILQIDEPFDQNVNPTFIQQALQSGLRFLSQTLTPGAVPFGSESHLRLSTANALAVVITDSETIQELNRQYRGIAAPTDVLSFENTLDPDFPELDPAADGYLGDIIIAYPVAQAQALATGHTPQDEIILLAVHGLLHLLGFDHDTPENKEAMWNIQQQVMTELKLAHIQPTVH